MKTIILFFSGFAFFIWFGCSTKISGPEQLPQYQSSVQVTLKGQNQLEFEVLGEGYGESVGSVSAFRFTTKDYDINEAYQEAIKSKGGDILLDARTQIVRETTCLFGILGETETFKVWGIVGRLKKDSQTPISITQPTYPDSIFPVVENINE